MNAGGVELGILWPAFVAGILVLATHVPLGIQVLERGIVFIDLAVAQIAGLGVIAAGVLGFPEHGLAVQAAAVCAALAGAALLTWTEQRAPRYQEALIGALFVLAASIGILLLAHDPHGGEHLQELLAGQILWVGVPQLAALGAVTLALVAAMALGAARRLGRFGFYAAFAIAVTASVQLVGVYLVFTSLVVPALGTVRRRGRARVLAGFALGVAGYAGGLWLSALFDLPTGPTIVCVLAAAALASFALDHRRAAGGRAPTG
jgi:zinc/manganese transport system permease protein